MLVTASFKLRVFIPVLLFIIGFLESVYSQTSVCRSISNRPISRRSLSRFQSDHKNFAVDLYKLASERSENRNLIFSPSSISLVLGMLYEGSRLKTRREIKNNFLKTVQRPHIRGGFDWLMNELTSQGKKYELHNANAMFVEQSMPMLEKFSSAIENCFSAVAETKDFANAPDKSRQEVNEWVLEQTNGKIENLIPESAVTSLTRMILTNAIYFKGDWLVPFDTNNGARTLKQVHFFPDPRNREVFQRVDMMHHQSKQAYLLEKPNFQVLGLPYKGDELTMFIFLPSNDYSLYDFEKEQLSGNNLKNLMDSAENSNLQQIQVSIPKFKMSHEVPLNEVLQAAGIKTMFKENEADFTRITYRDSLYVSDTFHKAVIEVNEKGTEAAAATSSIVSTRSGRRKKNFSANRPFLFLIRHNSSDTILFMGRFSDADGLDSNLPTFNRTLSSAH